MDNEVSVELITIKGIKTFEKRDEDYIVKCVGEFGVWQAGVCFIASLARFISMWNMFSIFFLTPVTNFKCVKFVSNITMEVKNGTCYATCQQYQFYNYIFKETLISEFGLICENSWKASLSQTVVMFGLLLGVSLFGWISDRYGRRKALLSSAFINVTLMLIVPLSTNYWVFISLRILIGVASGGTLTVGVVYILEIVGPRYRDSIGAIALLPDGLAGASLSAFAYYSSSWRMYSMGYAIVSLIFVSLMALLPESPRWSVSIGQVDNAIVVLTRIAKFNKQDPSQIKFHVKQYFGDVKIKKITKPSYLDFSKSKFKVLAITIIWTSVGACYLGIDQYLTFLSDDLLTTVMLTGLIQIPVCPMAIVINKLLKRKTAIILSLLTAEISMLALVFLPQDHWACIYMGLTGFAACSGLFDIIYVFTSELFPTSIRNMAYGLGASGGKTGAMVAPFIVTLTPYWVPASVFAGIVFTSSVFCFFLPETKQKKLLDK